MSETLMSGINDLLVVKLYGQLVSDVIFDPLAATAIGMSQLASEYGSKTLRFARIHGFYVSGRCVRLPAPVLTIVPDTGVKADGCGFDPAVFTMWILPKDTSIVSFHQTVKQLGDVGILVDVESDFRIYNVTFDGANVTGRIRSYLRLKQSNGFGGWLFNIVVVDRDDEFTVPIGVCITVYSIGVAAAQVCLRTGPNRVCASVTVGIDLPVIGHWGQTFDIACINL